MLIVMPRCRSSGALSISSNALNLLPFGSRSERTLVIAAVKVVLPWSIWPIVPMLRWGLVRSNFCLAMEGVAPHAVRPPGRGIDAVVNDSGYAGGAEQRMMAAAA